MKTANEPRQEIPNGRRGGQGENPGASVTLLVLIGSLRLRKARPGPCSAWCFPNKKLR